MERGAISMLDEFGAELAGYVQDYGYDNRSEAIRDLARLGLERARIEHGVAAECVAFPLPFAS